MSRSNIFGGFPFVFPIGTRVAKYMASTWFHKPIEGAVKRFLVPLTAPFTLGGKFRNRHCERSEAIHDAQWIAASLRSSQ